MTKAELEVFFSSELASSAAARLKEDACIALYVGEELYYFVRKQGKNALIRRKPRDPDLSFWIPVSTMRHLVELHLLPGTGLASMGVAVFESLVSSDAERKVRCKVHTSFFALFSRGYFSVLQAGGPEVASYMAKLGLGGIAQIKAILQKIRG